MTTYKNVMNKAPHPVIRVAIARNPPDAFPTCQRFPEFSQTLECLFPGWCLEVLFNIAQYINVTIQPVIMPYKVGSVDWGTFNPNGNWSGVLGYLQRDEVDTACLMYQKTTLREQYFAFANSIISVRPVYVTLQRQETMMSMLSKLFSSFDTQLWIIMLGLILFQMTFVELIVRFETQHILHRHWHPFQSAWTMFQLLLKQREEVITHEIQTLSGKVTNTVWSICQCVLIVELYRVLLLSRLLNPVKIEPFRSPDEMVPLIASKEYKLVTNYLGNWYFDELKNSNASHYVALRAATADNPVVLAKSVADALDMVQNGGYIYPIQEDSSSMQFALKRCNIAQVTNGMPQRTAHFAFQKNSSWLPVWNEAIVLTQSFQQRTFRKYFENGFIIGGAPKCDDSQFQERPEGSPLDFRSILGPLIMWLIGIVISISTQFFEIFYRRHHKIHKKIFRKRGQGAPILFSSH